MNETPFTKEILDQPAALVRLVQHYRDPAVLDILRMASHEIRSAERVVFSGMGTSLHAPYLVLRKLQRTCSAVEICDAGELLHFGLESFRGSELLVAISQSGESAETKRLVQALKGRTRILSILNNESSFMGLNSDRVLPILAGEEASISTKTYTNTLALLLILEAGVRDLDLNGEMDSLEEVAGVMEGSLPESRAQAVRVAEYLQSPPTLHVVARGTDLVTARQLALIAKEGADVFTESISAGLFRHGPIELGGSRHNILFIAAQGNRPELTLGLAEETAGLGSRVVALTDSDQEVMVSSPALQFTLKSGGIESRFFPLLCAPFVEYLVHEIARQKGREAGVFRHAQKITDTE